jgi:hypothetical protein
MFLSRPQACCDLDRVATITARLQLGPIAKADRTELTITLHAALNANLDRYVKQRSLVSERKTRRPAAREALGCSAHAG